MEVGKGHEERGVSVAVDVTSRRHRVLSSRHVGWGLNFVT
jgi:hypothetical protein